MYINYTYTLLCLHNFIIVNLLLIRLRILDSYFPYETRLPYVMMFSTYRFLLLFQYKDRDLNKKGGDKPPFYDSSSAELNGCS